jgi:hypothetical protein
LKTAAGFSLRLRVECASPRISCCGKEVGTELLGMHEIEASRMLVQALRKEQFRPRL